MSQTSELPPHCTSRKRASNVFAKINQDYRIYTGLIDNCVIKDVPDSDYDDESNIKAIYKLSEIYDMERVIKKGITRLLGYKKKLEDIHQYHGFDVTRYYRTIVTAIESGQSKLKLLKYLPAIDKLSTEKKVEFTGNVGATWYDAPLQEFLVTHVHSSVSTQYGYVEIRNVKDLLHYIQFSLTNVDVISTDEGAIEKTVLLDFLNKLLLIEMTLDKFDRYGRKNHLEHSRKLDKIIYQIHKDFQMPVTRIQHILLYCFFKEYGYSEILKRSTRHFFRHENIPNWVLKSWKGYENNDNSQGASMEWSEN